MYKYHNEKQRFAMTLSEHNVLPDAEVQRLVFAAQAGNKVAREKVIKANMRLVLFLVSRINRFGFAEFDDAVQAGRIGVNRAIDLYNPEKGTKFATYADKWVKAKIREVIEQTIAMPGIDTRNILFSKKAERDAATTNMVYHVAGGAHRLDAPIHDDSATTYADQLEYDNVENLEDTVLEAERRALSAKLVDEITTGLDARRRRVLMRRLGEDGTKLREIGEEIGVTREYVRQLELSATEKVKRMASTPKARALRAELLEYAA